MKRLVALLILTFLISPFTQAQLDSIDQKIAKQASLQLTVVTLQFLATDTVDFPKLHKPECKSCNTDADLRKFIEDYKLTGAQDVLLDRMKKPFDMSLATPWVELNSILANYASSLYHQIVESNPQKKNRREKLSSCTDYKKNINSILNNAKDDSFSNHFISVYNKEAEKSTLNNRMANLERSNFIISIALFLSLMALISFIYLLIKQQNSKSSLLDEKNDQIKKNTMRTVQPSSDQLDNLRKKINEITDKLENISDRLTLLDKGNKMPKISNEELLNRLETLEYSNVSINKTVTDRLDELIIQIESINNTVSKFNNQSEGVVNNSIAEPDYPTHISFEKQLPPGETPSQHDSILYGRIPDSDGFRVSSLLDKPSHDTIFEIEKESASQAIYRVTEQSGTQQLALSDPYSYLSDACKYTSKPVLGARIHTKKPGRLSLQGDKWKIIEKAEISFHYQS